MSKELFKALLEIPQVVEIIKNWGLSSNIDINTMLKMARINEISVDVVNNIPIREYGRKKIDQTPKYKIPNNGTYYVHHACYKKQKAREMWW